MNNAQISQAEKDKEQKRADADKDLIDKAVKIRADRKSPPAQEEPASVEDDENGPSQPVEEDLDLSLLDIARRWMHPGHDNFAPSNSNFSRSLKLEKRVPKILKIMCDDDNCSNEKQVFRDDPYALIVRSPNADIPRANPDTLPTPPAFHSKAAGTETFKRDETTPRLPVKTNA